MIEAWHPASVVPADATDETIEALARNYVGRVASVDESAVEFGEYERGAILVAQAEIALALAAGETPHLWFSGPPLRIEVQARGA